MQAASASLMFPFLGEIYGWALPWAEMLLRAITGLALVPHGLRLTFGVFKESGAPIHNVSMFRAQLKAAGYVPAWFWAPAILITELLCGPLLALGLFTRIAAVPITIFLLVSNFQRWRVGGYFYDTKGFEYTMLWTAAAFYFLVKGGGIISMDHLVLSWKF